MEINIRHVDKYSEVTIEAENVTLATGFLNEKESLELARAFIYAAHELTERLS